MAKNKNRPQPTQPNRGKETTTERGAEQQGQSAVQSDAPSPSNLAERGKRQKRFGHN
ncbi:hypothetical protein [Streptomyces cavernicola]|uniref:Small hydrophilic protein n=1 Tax=Streptomyces cavernicola TaxID=3043613 RepID=A0ABT6S4G8_9ACTN|nr:hypothetical protein [Streptomyces sp. B-S-A6]MDI3402991.1 hypothetical protein [Streptomyces sp. B-S-A6]